jgi:DNA polymerase-3 subunit alpha
MNTEEYLPSTYTGASDFAHTHCHSVYSSLDGVSTIQEYAEACVKNGWGGMAITEHGHMGSVPDFFYTFRDYNLKSIFGCEIYYNDWHPEIERLKNFGVNVRSSIWRKDNLELSTRINRNRHLTVLCKNEIGAKNLLSLTTEAFEDGLYGAGVKQYNRIWFEKLCSKKEGLIILSGCLNGPVAHELRYKELRDKEDNIIVERDVKTRLNAAVNYIKKFKAAFGEDYYIELQMPGIEDDHEIFWILVELANHFKIKTIISNDAHYISRVDFDIQKIMMAVAQDTTVDSPDLFHVNSSEQFFKTRSELWSTFMSNRYKDRVSESDFHAMCNNTLEVFDKCQQVELDGSPKFPSIENDDATLIKEVMTSMKARGLDKNQDKFVIDGKEVTYMEQAKIELSRIISKGFSSYFLILQDLISFGRSKSFIFGPRGSGGGSVVVFLLGISNIDPLLWELSFDRFLSESRGGFRLNTSMPKPVNI